MFDDFVVEEIAENFINDMDNEVDGDPVALIDLWKEVKQSIDEQLGMPSDD